jgi:DNA repair protein SbcD/Mre11
VKFLHAADVHLDSPLQGLAAREDLPVAELRGATRRAFSALVDCAIAEDVAFLLIAGDLYDGEWRDFSTGLFFAAEMRRLGRPCFVIRGNHDARSEIARELTLPPNVHEFPSRQAASVTRPELGVALHGRSFPARAVPEDLAASYPPPLPGLLNIGLLHTSAEDRGEHETYAPCSVASLALKGYDYWALGHIHQRRVLHERPWIVFPGNLQGRHVREAGAKGASLVTVQDAMITAVEHRTLDVLRWARIGVDVTGADAAALTARLEQAILAAVAQAEGRPLVARVTLSGETALHERLAADQDSLAAECARAAIEAGGTLWIERLAVATRPVAAPRDSLAPLRAAFAGALEDPALRAALLAHLAELRGRLPGPARLEAGLPADDTALAALAEEAWPIAAEAIAEAGRK